MISPVLIPALAKLALGDVIVDGKNLLGDGVNIAARLESIAPPGGICVSEIVYNLVKSKISDGFLNKGKQKLKNIKDKKIIIHNAPFDVGFIEHEYKLANHIIKLAENCNIFDTLVYARKLHPGQKNSLDADGKVDDLIFNTSKFIESFSFNKAIAKIYELTNFLAKKRTTPVPSLLLAAHPLKPF